MPKLIDTRPQLTIDRIIAIIKTSPFTFVDAPSLRNAINCSPSCAGDSEQDVARWIAQQTNTFEKFIPENNAYKFTRVSVNPLIITGHEVSNVNLLDDVQCFTVIKLLKSLRLAQQSALTKDTIEELTQEEAAAICYFAGVPMKVNEYTGQITFAPAHLYKRNGAWVALTPP